MKNIITVTDAALDCIKKSVGEAEALGLRVDVKAEGCHGMAYALDFVKEADPTDILMCVNEVNIYIAAKAVIFVSGMEINYINTPTGGKITFANPNAKSHCSCGQSFCAYDDTGQSCKI
jgi:iron-sulfur cluster assembly protein